MKLKMLRKTTRASSTRKEDELVQGADPFRIKEIDQQQSSTNETAEESGTGEGEQFEDIQDVNEGLNDL